MANDSVVIKSPKFVKYHSSFHLLQRSGKAPQIPATGVRVDTAGEYPMATLQFEAIYALRFKHLQSCNVARWQAGH